MSGSPIPITYRAIFFLFDFLLPLGGVYLHLFNPTFVILGWISSPSSPLSTETIVLMDAMAGFFSMLVVLHLSLLLYRRNDVGAWKIQQAATVMTDFFMLWAFVRSMDKEGRELGKVESWRNEDYGNLLGYAGITIVRLLFVAGVGVGKEVGEENEKELKKVK